MFTSLTLTPTEKRWEVGQEVNEAVGWFHFGIHRQQIILREVIKLSYKKEIITWTENKFDAL